jgi:tetratricopeptide (TPR) repeat protein
MALQGSRRTLCRFGARMCSAVGFGVITLGVGCAHLPSLPPTAAADPPPVQVAKESTEPKRQPLPATCVAFGDFNESLAESVGADPKGSPADRERYRDQARRAYQQALKIDPKDVSALLALGRLYTLEGDHDRAIATFRKATEVKPKDAGPWCALGMCHARSHEWGEALETLSKAVQLDPENRIYAHTLGYCQARAGHYEQALATLTKLDGDAQAHYDLARMAHHVNEDEVSKRHLHEALNANPEMGSARQLLAVLEDPTRNQAGTINITGVEAAR